MSSTRDKSLNNLVLRENAFLPLIFEYGPNKTKKKHNNEVVLFKMKIKKMQ